MKPDEIIQQMKNDRKDREFIPTGFKNIDAVVGGGFFKREIVIIGAPTGTGKSFLCGQMFYQMAKQNFSCAYFSLEIGAQTIISRLVGGMTNVHPTKVFTGTLGDFHEKVEKTFDQVGARSSFMHIEDKIFNLKDIVKVIEENSFDVVFIDYLQLVLAIGSGEYERVTKAITTLQQIAISKNCLMIVAAQLSNDYVRNTSKNYLEFKGSGYIAAAADFAFLMDRGDFELADYTLTLVLRKSRREYDVSGGIKLNIRLPGGLLYE